MQVRLIFENCIEEKVKSVWKQGNWPTGNLWKYDME
jgi:hypothetical protein